MSLIFFSLLRCLVGQLDQEKDKTIDLDQLKAEPIPETRHGL